MHTYSLKRKFIEFIIIYYFILFIIKIQSPFYEIFCLMYYKNLLRFTTITCIIVQVHPLFNNYTNNLLLFVSVIITIIITI